MFGRMNRTALRCESLEGRDCPAAQAFQFGTFLVVVGDANANNVVINDMGNGQLGVVTDGKFTVKTNVKTVIVATGAGDDTVAYNLAGSASAANLVSITTGSGNDDISLNGAAMQDSLTFAVNSGIGDDQISVNLGGVPLGQTVNLFLSGGAGNDAFDISASGEIDGTLNVWTNGGGGADTMSGDITAAAGSTGAITAVLRFVRGRRARSERDGRRFARRDESPGRSAWRVGD